jgi:alkylhydroperoxidase family enzyme
MDATEERPAPLRPGDIEWGPSLLPDEVDPELAAKLKRMFGGTMPNVFRKVGTVPWLVELWLALMRRRHSCVPIGLIDVATFVASQENSCRYCYGGQRATIRLLGFSEKQVQQIENRLELEQLSPLERAAVPYAAALTRMLRPPTAAEREPLLQAGLSPLQVAELTFLIALNCAATRVGTLAAVPPDLQYEELPEKWFMKLLGPVLRTMMKPETVKPAPIPPGPFAAVLAPLGDTVGARAMREAIDGLLADSPLPRRTKLLVLLTIAQAMGSTAMRAECVLLLGEVGLTAEQADEVSQHLASPVLDPLEAKLVPLARETIRYRPPAPIQARVREATVGLPSRAIRDCLGAAAVGNALGRIGTLL